jgi:hypothetical protein
VKNLRLLSQTARFEDGQVLSPENALWLYLTDLLGLPNAPMVPATSRRRDLKQHTDEKEGNAIMRRLCSDSLMTASQVDGVFGSDRTV